MMLYPFCTLSFADLTSRLLIESLRAELNESGGSS